MHYEKGNGRYDISNAYVYITHTALLQVEEERYANKVIEYFNGGTLKLDEQDRGITLRAYLSQKLGCDPMRITKKYTGAMCLGKRVYHQYRQHGRPELVEQHNAELQVLEDEFRAKLAQISARRKGSSSNNEKFIAGSPAVTTPGIEALLKSHPYHPDAAWPPQPGQVFISPYTPDYLNSLLPSQTTLGVQPAAKQGKSLLSCLSGMGRALLSWYSCS